MTFVDEITLRAKAGKGGDGVVRWLHLKGKEFGGPSGGDGGRGGDVILRAVRDLNILARYRGRPVFEAGRGEDGFRNEMEGKNGEHAYIDVPVGSRVVHQESGAVFELLTEGQEIVAFRGGRGGYGNARFKSSTNQYPDRAIKGEPGESGTLLVEVELIADVGLVGEPNAGKSSLLNAFTKKNTKVASYAFTTLEPSLGVLFGFVLADIPGLIEGAAEGKGLGHQFLRHVKRTRALLHCVSAEHDEVTVPYQTVRAELSAYDSALSEKPELIFLTKVDEVSREAREEKIHALRAFNPHVIPVSILDDDLLKTAQDELVRFIENLPPRPGAVNGTLE